MGPCAFAPAVLATALQAGRRRSRAVSYGVESDDRQRGEFISYSE
jgi:hypothetical protein